MTRTTMWHRFEQEGFHAFIQRQAARVTMPPARAIRVGDSGGQTFVQIEGFVRDLSDPLNPGPFGWQGGGKIRVSEHVCESEFFQMLLGALLAFDEHENREMFLVDGIRAYGPHISLAALQKVAEVTEFRS